jgi:hypothetical protein
MLRTEWVRGHQWYVNKYAPSLSNQLDPRPDSPKIRSVKQLGGRSIFRKVPWNSSVRCPVELPRRRSVGSPGIASLLSIRSRVRGFIHVPSEIYCRKPQRRGAKGFHYDHIRHSKENYKKSFRYVPIVCTRHGLRSWPSSVVLLSKPL